MWLTPKELESPRWYSKRIPSNVSNMKIFRESALMSSNLPYDKTPIANSIPSFGRRGACPRSPTRNQRRSLAVRNPASLEQWKLRGWGVGHLNRVGVVGSKELLPEGLFDACSAAGVVHCGCPSPVASPSFALCKPLEPITHTSMGKSKVSASTVRRELQPKRHDFGVETPSPYRF